uniref:Putative secreted protein n=1 Tax=Ixodes ricinus TaxID=34613 RepID=A0A6B0UXI9_IXORI
MRVVRVVVVVIVDVWPPSRATLCSGANRPCRAGHRKYFVPATEPSFLPTGSSSSTPAHCPVANSVGPMKRRVPAFMPDEAFTMTRSPTRRPQSVMTVDVCIVTARGDDLVLPVGELTRVVVTCVFPGATRVAVVLVPLAPGPGKRESRSGRAKTPLLGSHWK